MLTRKMKSVATTAIVLVSLVCAVKPQSLKLESPSQGNNNNQEWSPEYKVGRVTHSDPKLPRLVILTISIDPSHFVCKDMVALARKLHTSFPSETRFGVIILDSQDALVNSSPIHETKKYLDARRGYYYFDLKANKEYIQFSTERGRPWDEIVIRLTK